jgi:hypothetical protein
MAERGQEGRRRPTFPTTGDDPGRQIQHRQTIVNPDGIGHGDVHVEGVGRSVYGTHTLRLGNYHGMLVVARDHRRPPARKQPLSLEAWDLLADYHRLMSLFEATIQEMPLAEAASVILGIGKTAAYKLMKKVEAYDGYPQRWFEAEVRARMERGGIHSGRATEPGKRANAFFNALGEGEIGKSYWRDQLAGRRTVVIPDDLRDAMAAASWGWIEAFDYWIHNHRLF